MDEFKNMAALDAGLISAAQAVEHYEITRYGTLKRWATELGIADAAKLLDETLQEESKTDSDLTKLADAPLTKREGTKSRLKRKRPGRRPPGSLCIRFPINVGRQTPSIDGFLSSRNFDSLVTGGCVLATVLGAFDRGFRTIIITDAICSSADEIHDAAMMLYASRIGEQVEIPTTEEVLVHSR